MDKYTYNEVYDKALSYFEGDELAARVWTKSFAMKDSNGNHLEASPNESLHRIASELARMESTYPSAMTEEEIFGLLDHFRYIVPQSSALIGIDNPYRLSALTNSYVIGIDGKSDSYGSICKIDEELVQLLKRHASVGHDLTSLRPKGLPIKNSAMESPGILPFMERYSNSVVEVKQEGGRGAQNLSVSVIHPDVEGFIEEKGRDEKLIGTTVTLHLTDEFMQKVRDNDYITTRFPVTGKTSILRRTFEASRIYRKFLHLSSRMTEPGILFQDAIKRENPSEAYQQEGFGYTSSTPYGNQALSNYESQHQMIINLTSYVSQPFEEGAQFDFALLEEHAKKALRMADDTIDLDKELIEKILQKLNEDPEEESLKTTERQLWEKIRDKMLRGRRVAIGVTGAADVLVMLGMDYGSDQGNDFLARIAKTITLACYDASVTLAEERGAFPIYDAEKEKQQVFIQRLHSENPALYNRMIKAGRRNICCTAIAPTSRISILTQTSAGIEPIYQLAYKRTKRVNKNDDYARIDHVNSLGDTFEEYMAYHPWFEKWMHQQGYYTNRRYTDSEINKIISSSPFKGNQVQDVSWKEKLHLISRIQPWIDQNISQTVNLPSGTADITMGKVYMEAWECGCKSISINIEGAQSTSLQAAQKAAYDFATRIQQTLPIRETRPRVLEADVVRFVNNDQPWVAFVGLNEGKPYEIFTGILDEDDGLLLPKNIVNGHLIKNIDEDGTKHYDFRYENKRGCKVTIEGLSEKFNKVYWNYAKLISGVLRYQMPIPLVIKLVSSLELDNDDINTWKNGVVKALKKYQNDNTDINSRQCPYCGGNTLIYQEGGMICKQCGKTNLG